MNGGRHNFPAGRLPAWALCLGCVLAAIVAGCEKKEAEPVGTRRGDEPSTVAAMAAVLPATRPAMLEKGASCVTSACHATMAGAPHIHGPVSQRACDACHAEDIGGHKYPLKREGAALCTFCHQVSGTMSNQHKALDQGCVVCHKPHVATSKFLLKTDTVERLCATCHEVPLKKHAHGPFAKGQCTLCHQAHQSETAKLLRGGNGSEHCFMCHTDMKQTMATAAHTHKPATENCVNCHSPHASDHEHELKKPVDETCLGCHEKVKSDVAAAKVAHGAMTTGKMCSNCHNAHATADAKLLRARMDKVCLSCHDKPMVGTDTHEIAAMKPVLTESKFLHGPVQTGDCSACHGAHGANQPNLLVRAFPKTFYTGFDIEKYALCFGCHEKQLVLSESTPNLTNFRDGQTNLHYVHVHRDEKGRTCKTCHAIHGSDLPNHMASDVPFEGSKWAMPILYEPTPDGGRCAPGCHTPREYRRGQPTTQPATGGVK